MLPYLELQEDNKDETEEKEEIIVPELRNKTVGEAKKQAKELGIELEIQLDEQAQEENISEKIITNQVPLPGIKINSDSKIYVSI